MSVFCTVRPRDPVLRARPAEPGEKFPSYYGPVEAEKGDWVTWTDGSPEELVPRNEFVSKYEPVEPEGQGEFFAAVDLPRGGAEVSFRIQDGPILEAGVNGCQVDEVVRWVRRWIEARNREFPCVENEMAVEKLAGAEWWLERRKARRTERGVEGRSEA